jgi:hypothetical protein
MEIHANVIALLNVHLNRSLTMTIVNANVTLKKSKNARLILTIKHADVNVRK